MGSHDEREDRERRKMKSADAIIYISDREEGEIVEASDMDDLSDISSEEEFLLRQRIKILENYNDVLERKEAKVRSFSDNADFKEIISVSLSDVSTSDDEPKQKNKSVIMIPDKVTAVKKIQRQNIPTKSNKPPYHRRRNRHRLMYKTNSTNIKDKMVKKKHKKTSINSESSAESDRENREKRRKLREAVRISNHKNDNTSLKLRLLTMLHKGTQDEEKCMKINDTVTNLPTNVVEMNFSADIIEIEDEPTDDKNLSVIKDSESKENSSDDDVEALRQLALQTKSKQRIEIQESLTIKDNISNDMCDNVSEEVDTDTAELRLIALKSAMLKKAMERKQRQKTIAKLKSSQVSLSNRQSLLSELEIVEEELQIADDTRNVLNNDTDVESVDMDIDDNPSNDECSKIESVHNIDEKQDEMLIDNSKVNENVDEISCGQNDHKLYLYNVYNEYDTADIPKAQSKKPRTDDDLEEDEDILRAKLLTSLSNNIKIEKSKKEGTNDPQPVPFQPPTLPLHANFVIKLGESDSGTDCESTRNLKVMHKRLTEQQEFQRSLDLFLKDARKVAEAKTPSREPIWNNTIAKKFTPMAVKHLPRADQQEYRRLVKRMTELEKVKQARQVVLLKNTSVSNPALLAVVRGNPLQEQYLKIANQNENNVSDNYLAQARDKITEASENILKIRQEVTQQITNVQNAANRFKMAKKELQLKKHALMLAENTLRSRQQVYRSLIKRSAKQNSFPFQRLNNKVGIENKKKTFVSKSLSNNSIYVNRLHMNQQSVVQQNILNSVSNKVKSDLNVPESAKEEQTKNMENVTSQSNVKSCDYQSPLQYKNSNNSWSDMDPNAVLCPFAVAGECKDSDCVYLHPKL